MTEHYLVNDVVVKELISWQVVMETTNILLEQQERRTKKQNSEDNILNEVFNLLELKHTMKSVKTQLLDKIIIPMKLLNICQNLMCFLRNIILKTRPKPRYSHR